MCLFRCEIIFYFLKIIHSISFKSSDEVLFYCVKEAERLSAPSSISQGSSKMSMTLGEQDIMCQSFHEQMEKLKHEEVKRGHP
jgi:hypothetical protein